MYRTCCKDIRVKTSVLNRAVKCKWPSFHAQGLEIEYSNVVYVLIGREECEPNS